MLCGKIIQSSPLARSYSPPVACYLVCLHSALTSDPPTPNPNPTTPMTTAVIHSVFGVFLLFLLCLPQVEVQVLLHLDALGLLSMPRVSSGGFCDSRHSPLGCETANSFRHLSKWLNNCGYFYHKRPFAANGWLCFVFFLFAVLFNTGVLLRAASSVRRPAAPSAGASTSLGCLSWLHCADN